MKRTSPLMIFSGLFKRNISADQIHNINFFFYQGDAVRHYEAILALDLDIRTTTTHFLHFKYC